MSFITQDMIFNDDGSVKDAWVEVCTKAWHYDTLSEAERNGLYIEENRYFFPTVYARNKDLTAQVNITINDDGSVDLTTEGISIPESVGTIVPNVFACMGFIKDSQLLNKFDEAVNECITDLGLSDRILLNIGIDGCTYMETDLIERICEWLYNKWNPCAEKYEITDKRYEPNPAMIYEPTVNGLTCLVGLAISRGANYLVDGSTHLTHLEVISELRAFATQIESSDIYAEFSRLYPRHYWTASININGHTNNSDRYASWTIDMRCYELKLGDGQYIVCTDDRDARGNEVNKFVVPTGHYITASFRSMKDYNTSTFNNQIGNAIQSGNAVYDYYGGWNDRTNYGSANYNYVVDYCEMAYNGTMKPYNPTGIMPRTGILLDDYPDWPDGNNTPVPTTEPDEPIRQPEPIKITEPIPRPKPPRPEPIPEPTPDEDVQPIPTPVPASTPDDDIVHIYNPSDAELRGLNGKLWDDTTIAELKKWWNNNPMDGIISLSKVFVLPEAIKNPSTQAAIRKPIVLGTWSDDTVKAKIIERYKEYEFDSIVVEREYDDYRDYEATVEIYLPCIGYRELVAEDVIGKQVKVKYNVDVVTGDFIAYVSVTRGTKDVVMYTYDGNMAVAYPVSGSSRPGLISNIIGTAGSVVTGALTGAIKGGPAGAGIGAGVSLASNIPSLANSRQRTIQRSGSMGGSLAALGIRYPYILVSRPIPYENPSKHELYGRAANHSARVSSMQGFTSFKEIHVEIARASDEEKNMIHSMLLEGIIV